MISFSNILIVTIAAILAIFMNYPSPPESPIIYQWRTTGGHFYYHGDFQIFYKDEFGNGTSGTVICLHGFPTSSFDWFKVWPKLKRQFNRVIALDFLGFGLSDKPRHHEYSIGEQADIVLNIAKYLSLKDVHVLAHDYGDTVALELLARQLEDPRNTSIQSTCLLNGGIFPDKHHQRLFQKILRTPIIGTVVSRFGNYMSFKHGLSEVFATKRKPKDFELQDFWHLLRLQDGYRVLGNLLTYIDERIREEDRWVGALKRTTVSVHMIYGAEDPVNPPPFAQHFREVIPKPSIKELSDVGHYVQLEAPEEMMDSYIEFLSSLK